MLKITIFWILIAVYIQHLTFSMTTQKNSSINCVENPCDRGDYCHDLSWSAHESDCTRWYYCDYGRWELHPDKCGEGVEKNKTRYDPKLCQCNYEYNVTCHVCPTTTLGPTIPPGTCPDTPEPCEEGVKYSDVSDCERYFLCSNQTLGQSRQCNYALGDLACDQGQVYPCVFDIHQSQCVHIHDAPSSFDCGVRCIRTWTTIVEETTMHFEFVTDDRDNSTSDDGLDDDSGGGNNAGAIVGGVFAALVVSAFIAFVIYKKHKPSAKVDVEETDDEE